MEVFITFMKGTWKLTRKTKGTRASQVETWPQQRGKRPWGLRKGHVCKVGAGKGTLLDAMDKTEPGTADPYLVGESSPRNTWNCEISVQRPVTEQRASDDDGARGRKFGREIQQWWATPLKRLCACHCPVRFVSVLPHYAFGHSGKKSRLSSFSINEAPGMGITRQQVLPASFLCLSDSLV